MQFILSTMHKHMYINRRVIQAKQKGFFHFISFFLFVNRYDIICILIAESYKQKLFSPFSPLLIGMLLFGIAKLWFFI
jgi:hypothetical protein